MGNTNSAEEKKESDTIDTVVFEKTPKTRHRRRRKGSTLRNRRKTPVYEDPPDLSLM